MTVIAAMTLVALLIIMLLMIIGLVLWQKRASIQLDHLREIRESLAVIEQRMQVLEETVRAGREEVRETSCILQEALAEDEDAGEEAELPQEPDQSAEEIPEPDAVESEEPESGVSEQEVLEFIQEEADFHVQPEEEQPIILDQSEQDYPKASKYNSGKSGKIYTEEELELLIKE